MPKWNEVDVEAVLFSPDGKTLATRMETPRTETAPRETAVGFWDVQSGRLLTNLVASPELRHPQVETDFGLGTVMAFSPGGNLLALCDLNKLQVRDARSMNLITNLIHPAPLGWTGSFRVMSIAFSGSLMAAGYRLGEIKIWDTKTWAELASWRAHPSFVLGLDFSPDGKLLGSGGSFLGRYSRVISQWRL
jgi:WD40 repeat protein